MANVNVPISALPTVVGGLTGAEVLPLDQGGTTKQATTGQIAALAGSAQLNANFLMVTNSALVPNGRALAVQPTLSLVDAGAGSTLTVGTAALTGDVTSAANSFVTTVAKINGAILGTTTAAAGNILIGSGAQWVTQAVTGAVSLTSAGVTALTASAFANPSVSIGLTANNGIATTAMRSDATPALSQSISPTWTGNHVFDPVAGNAITSTTASTSIAKVFNTNQAPGAVTNNAATSLNSFTISTDDINAGANFVNGWTFSHGIGNAGNALGGRQAMEVLLSFNAATNAANTNRNYVSLITLAQAQSGDGGGAGTEKGALFALNPYVLMTAAAAHWVSANGIELDMDIRAGSTVLDKFGLKVTQVATDSVSGSRNDAAFSLANQTGAPGWDVGFQVGDGSANAPIKTTGSILSIKGTPTITNGIDLTGATFTGSPFKSLNFNIGLNGDLTCHSLTMNANAAALTLPAGGNTYIAGVDGSNTISYWDAYQNGGAVSNAMIFRLAGGTGAVPSGVGAAQTIFSFGSRTFTSAGAFTVNNAVILFETVNAQTNTDQSSQIVFQTTPTGSVASAKATALTIQASGGLSVGVGAPDPGIGALLATDIYSNDATFLIRTKTTLTNSSSTQTATLTNAPATGNPTKWFSVDDNGTPRRIPAW